ncbi:uncharacterized protein LOC110856340 isoform X2 [Folsomia candida]|uniref:uncharacterized protein LOC110856340 isoform X2 n=1 Tax=Folsomia candida TaxID=158441 RepID=UPI0016050EC8|nr:uncharacterized protein LOC110856340 isoform X2 [Folsomia candida]
MQISSNTQPTMDTEEESLSAEERESFASSAEGPPLKELITEEFELGDRSDLEISHWWKTLTLISYFVTGVSGLATSIALGDVLAAFQNRCILYAKIGLINMDDFDGYKLTEQNIAGDKWGDTYDCEFCEFASLFSVIFSGMLFAMFLQCGRGGITSKGLRRSWEFVPLALLITAIFFIIGTVIFAKTIGGFAYFCDYIVRDSNSPGNITNCPQVLGYHFPWDDHGTNLYTESEQH